MHRGAARLGLLLVGTPRGLGETSPPSGRPWTLTMLRALVVLEFAMDALQRPILRVAGRLFVSDRPGQLVGSRRFGHGPVPPAR